MNGIYLNINDEIIKKLKDEVNRQVKQSLEREKNK